MITRVAAAMLSRFAFAMRAETCLAIGLIELHTMTIAAAKSYFASLGLKSRRGVRDVNGGALTVLTVR